MSPGNELPGRRSAHSSGIMGDYHGVPGPGPWMVRLRAASGPFWRFCAVGASGVLVDLGIYQLLLTVGWPNALCRALAIAVAMTSNFALNRRLTFPGARQERVLPQYARYVGSNGIGALISWSASVALGAVLPPTRLFRSAAALAGIGVGTVSNFLLAYLWVFARRRPETGAGVPKRANGDGR